MKPYKLIIFDLDGTLVKTKSGKTFRENPQDWEFIPGRKEVVQSFMKNNVQVAIATNQGGVAFGIYDPDEMADAILDVKDQLDAFDKPETSDAVACTWPPSVDAVWCFSHPDGTVEEYRQRSGFRKPGPGMLYQLMASSGVYPSDTLMVGDREDDLLAAHGAGVDFVFASDFFADKPFEVIRP